MNDEITIVENKGTYAVCINGVLQASGTAEDCMAELAKTAMAAARSGLMWQEHFEKKARPAMKRARALFTRLLADDGNYCSLGSEHRAAIKLIVGPNIPGGV